MSDPRTRISFGDIQTRFTKGTLSGHGANYLKGDEIDMRTGLGLAIGALFGPLQAALEGEPLESVEALIQKAERTCHAYWALARSSTQPDSKESSVVEPDIENTDTYFEMD